MEAHKEEQLLALLDAKKDEFCTANNNDCKSCLMEDGPGTAILSIWHGICYEQIKGKITGKDRGKTYKTPV